MLESFKPSTDEAKRQLYAALTRAKRNLTVHLNGNYLDNIITENVERVNNKEIHLPPNELAMHLTHEDVYLGYFEFVQQRINGILSGDILNKTENGYANAKGDLVLKFSKKFIEVLSLQERKGYKLKEVKVNFVLYWKKPGEEKETKIILPELYFEK